MKLLKRLLQALRPAPAEPVKTHEPGLAERLAARQAAQLAAMGDRALIATPTPRANRVLSVTLEPEQLAAMLATPQAEQKVVQLVRSRRATPRTD